MFSLKSFLDKVSQVQTELSDRLNSPGSERSTPDLQVEEGHDITTGSGLMNKYQEIWEDIHCSSMSQADSALLAARETTHLHARLQHQDMLLTQLTSHIAELPALSGAIERCTGIVRETGLNLSSLQVELEKLEEECNKLHVERMKAVHRHHLDSYREERNRELTSRKTLMEQTHHDSLRVKAIQECMVLKERHTTFNEEFRRDMEVYRETGHLGMRTGGRHEELSVRAAQTAPLDTLESFVPDPDSDLSNFLETTESENTTSLVENLSLNSPSLEQNLSENCLVDNFLVDSLSENTLKVGEYLSENLPSLADNVLEPEADSLISNGLSKEECTEEE